MVLLVRGSLEAQQGLLRVTTFLLPPPSHPSVSRFLRNLSPFPFFGKVYIKP